MKILVASSTFPRWDRDTVPTFVHTLSKGLVEKGHEVHVVAPHAHRAAVTEIMDGMKVHRFRYAPSAMESLCYNGGILANLKAHRANWLTVPGFFLAEYAALSRLIQRERFDVVHAHWAVPQGIVASLPNAGAKSRIVVSAHGSDIAAARGPLFTALVRRALRVAQICTTNSIAMQREIRDLAGVAAKVIPMGVDVAAFSEGRSPRRGVIGPRSRLLFVGRLTEGKGLQVLIDALPMISRSVPEVSLTVVGDGPARADVARRAKELGVEDRVELVGAVRNLALPSYYREADVLVVPSLAEGLGVVILEGAVAELPVVASRAGGIPDIVEDGVTGLLVPPGDPARLAEAVVRMLRDHVLSQSTAQEARRKVEARFAWDAVVNSFDELFRQVVESPRR